MPLKWYLPIRISDYFSINNVKYFPTELISNLNIVLSIFWILNNKKFRKKLFKYENSLREILSANSGFLLDSGSFTYYRKGIKPPNIDEIADIYNNLDIKEGFHPDIPVSFLMKNNLRSPKLKSNLLIENINNAIKFENLINKPFKLYVVAQGITKFDYFQQIQTLIECGFKNIAIGGIAFRGMNPINEILDKIGELNIKGNIKIHLLGCGRLKLILKHKYITSFDCSTPLDDGHRDSSGLQTYFYINNHYNLYKIRLLYLRENIHNAICDCIFCATLGNKIYFAGKTNFNRGREYHNTNVFNKFIKNLKYNSEIKIIRNLYKKTLDAYFP